LRRKGLLLFTLALLPWLCLSLFPYFELALWGAVAGLVIVLAMFLLMPAGRKWGILQAFSLLFFLVACLAVAALRKDIDTRVPNLLAGGFACLVIMAGYGALEKINFPAHYLYLDFPDSMSESPSLHRTFQILTLSWDAIFLLGLIANIFCMLALHGKTSTTTSSIVSTILVGAGIILTPLMVFILPRRMESGLVEKGPLSIKWQPTILTPGRDLRKNEYDAAIVGSGMGGLACASLLANAGMKVMVSEKGRLSGGYCQTYDWEGYPLNAGPTMLIGGSGSVLGSLFARLGLEREIPMRNLEWGLADGKVALRLGRGFEEDVAKIGNKFPSSREGLKRLLLDLRRFRGEVLDRDDFLSSPLPINLDEYHEQFLRHPFSARWQNMSFQRMLEDYLPDERLGILLGRLATLLGGDPRTFPAYEGANLLVSLFLDGISYPVNHFSHMTEKLIGLIREKGSEVLTSCGAEEVLLKGDGSSAGPIGLRLADGSQVRSNVVILNIDPRRAISGLIQPSSLGMDFLKEMEKLRPSCSAFLLHLIFRDNLKIPERVFLFPSKPRQIRTGDTFLEVDSLVLSKEKCTIEGKDGCVLLARINIPANIYHVFEDASKEKELGAELASLVKEEIAAILPSVKKSLKEFVTLPTHLSRLTSNSQGSAFGFAPLHSQWYYHRPGPRLPLPNLYLVGSWSRYGGGLEGAALSGVITARELCGESPYPYVASYTGVPAKPEEPYGEDAGRRTRRSPLKGRRRKSKGEHDGGE
jgi:phytoene dehydrogenase-like protein